MPDPNMRYMPSSFRFEVVLLYDWLSACFSYVMNNVEMRYQIKIDNSSFCSVHIVLSLRTPYQSSCQEWNICLFLPLSTNFWLYPFFELSKHIVHQNEIG